ncbi:hypothetical protein B0T18DRAFT_9207 [Schizothecium vesticola]|uniref:Uncharacterized protein n=1 Tax=Schizothecium vesticola TaxID=314040 RepID=A0AA40F8M5_9PEZI|nr:hypothetical protein B0T18DRAFT_9207 [Schizothecium vesticola]
MPLQKNSQLRRQRLLRRPIQVLLSAAPAQTKTRRAEEVDLVRKDEARRVRGEDERRGGRGREGGEGEEEGGCGVEERSGGEGGDGEGGQGEDVGDGLGDGGDYGGGGEGEGIVDVGVAGAIGVVARVGTRVCWVGRREDRGLRGLESGGGGGKGLDKVLGGGSRDGRGRGDGNLLSVGRVDDLVLVREAIVDEEAVDEVAFINSAGVARIDDVGHHHEDRVLGALVWRGSMLVGKRPTTRGNWAVRLLRRMLFLMA